MQIQKLKQKLKLKQCPEFNTLYVQSSSFSSTGLQPKLQEKLKKIDAFTNMKRFKKMKSCLKQFKQTHQLSCQIKVSNPNSTRLDYDNIRIQTSQNITERKSSKLQNVHQILKQRTKSNENNLFAVKQNKRKKQKYMKVFGHSMNSEVVPSSFARKTLNKNKFLKQLTRKNRTMETEPEDKNIKRIFNEPCRPWSSKKMIQDYNIIFQ